MKRKLLSGARAKRRKGVAKAQQPNPLKKRIGRPPGKASDPEFFQTTVYIRRDTYVAARKRLLDERTDFSELIERLVSQWIGTRKEKIK